MAGTFNMKAPRIKAINPSYDPAKARAAYQALRAADAARKVARQQDGRDIETSGERY